VNYQDLVHFTATSPSITSCLIALKSLVDTVL
jgi:hypothetical protein